MNFDTAAGSTQKQALMEEAVGCNRVQVVVAVGPPFTVESVTMWRVGTTVAIVK